MRVSTLVPASIARCSAARIASAVRIGLTRSALAQKSRELPPFARDGHLGRIARLLAFEQGETSGARSGHAHGPDTLLDRQPGQYRADQRHELCRDRLQIVAARTPVAKRALVLTVPAREDLCGRNFHSRV